MEMWIALIVTTSVLVMIPGPNVALIIANTVRYGFWFGAITVAGTTLGIGIQLLCIVMGLVGLLNTVAGALFWLKWIGVFYLFYLGVQAFCEKNVDLSTVQVSQKPVSTVFWEGLGLALINPKTLLFNAAFLPQFLPSPQVNALNGSANNLFAVALVYLLVLFIGDVFWALFARSVTPLLRKLTHMRSTILGGVYFAAGAGLAFAGWKK